MHEFKHGFTENLLLTLCSDVGVKRRLIAEEGAELSFGNRANKAFLENLFINRKLGHVSNFMVKRENQFVKQQ